MKTPTTDELIDMAARLRDLHKQATSERSHYYVGSLAYQAALMLETVAKALADG